MCNLNGIIKLLSNIFSQQKEDKRGIESSSHIPNELVKRPVFAFCNLFIFLFFFCLRSATSSSDAVIPCFHLIHFRFEDCLQLHWQFWEQSRLQNSSSFFYYFNTWSMLFKHRLHIQLKKHIVHLYRYVIEIKGDRHSSTTLDFVFLDFESCRSGWVHSHFF